MRSTDGKLLVFRQLWYKKGFGKKSREHYYQLKKDGFGYLQKAGEFNWKAYHKHKWLKPFAWIYQTGRYAKQGFQAKRGGQLSEDIARGRRRSELLKQLQIGQSKK